jgi:manganese transport protein
MIAALCPGDTRLDLAERLRGTSRRTQDDALAVLEGHSRRRGPARLLPFLGPAFIAAIAYIDPGNFATNLQGGSAYGYALLWIVAAASLSAAVMQYLAAKLGLASGRNLAELCREHYRPSTVVTMWAAMEIVAAATDVAEFVGASIAWHILLPVSLPVAAGLTAVAVIVVLALERHGFRPLEAVMAAAIGAVALAYLVEVPLAGPRWGDVAHGLFVPTLPHGALYLAVGIIGATVMPHVIFLHSALTQDRLPVRNARTRHRILRLEALDIGVAMTIATLTNLAMLVMAAATFHRAGFVDVAGLTQAYRTLIPLLGGGAALVYALALLASGVASSTVGTVAGQVIMQGFLGRRIPLWVRRALTMIPAFLVVASGVSPTTALVFTQVIISFGLPLALLPLARFTSDGKLMGPLRNRPTTRYAAYTLAWAITALNLILILQTLGVRT